MNYIAKIKFDQINRFVYSPFDNYKFKKPLKVAYLLPLDEVFSSFFNESHSLQHVRNIVDSPFSYAKFWTGEVEIERTVGGIR